MGYALLSGSRMCAGSCSSSSTCPVPLQSGHSSLGSSIQPRPLQRGHTFIASTFHGQRFSLIETLPSVIGGLRLHVLTAYLGEPAT